MSSTYYTKSALFFAELVFVLGECFGGIAGEHFISGCGGKGSGVQSLRFSGLTGCIYAYSKLQAYESLSLCYRLNSALKCTETEPFSVCRFRPKLPAWKSRRLLVNEQPYRQLAEAKDSTGNFLRSGLVW